MSEPTVASRCRSAHTADRGFEVDPAYVAETERIKVLAELVYLARQGFLSPEVDRAASRQLAEILGADEEQEDTTPPGQDFCAHDIDLTTQRCRGCGESVLKIKVAELYDRRRR